MAHNTHVRRRHARRRRSPASSRASSPAMPSRGWSDAVEHEAHRTFYNWLGCAIGAARHEAADAALAAVAMLEPAAAGQRARPQRTRRHGERRAGQRHHVAHLRLRRHAPEDHHPSGRAGGVGRAGAGRAARRERARRDRRAGARHRRGLPHRQRDVPRPLRPRLAHHRLDRHARRSGRLRPAARARRAADRDGAGHRRVAAGGPARTVRHDDQALSSGRRGAGRAHVGLARAARLHRQPARAGSAARLRAGGLGQARVERGDRRARRALRNLVQHLQAVCLRHRHPSEHRRLRAVARARRHARTGASASSCACTRWCWS